MKADVTILGGGPGGVAAALAARARGFETVLVEKDAIGGVCLHRGCIPTKSLIADADRFPEGCSEAEKKDAFRRMVRKKESVIARLHQGAQKRLEADGVTLLRGEARIVKADLVRVREEAIETRYIVIATGSRPKALPGLPFDGTHVLSSDDLLRCDAIPASLLVVGAGPTGCEFASLFHALGSRVTIVEMAPVILPGFDEDISETLRTLFVRRGIGVRVNETVRSVEKHDRGVSIRSSSGETLQAEKVLVSIGRLPNHETLGLEASGISLKNGFISVDRGMRTTVSTVFAVGDVTGQRPLAHVASHQGRVAVDVLAGEREEAENEAIPECVFTHPEVASVGSTEQALRGAEKHFAVGRSPFIASAKAHLLGQKEGFVKLIGDPKTGKLLGAHLMGPHVTELLGELTLALRMAISISEIRKTIHPHPTLSEVVEAAADAFVKE